VTKIGVWTIGVRHRSSRSATGRRGAFRTIGV
jgi:hypothetical protein